MTKQEEQVQLPEPGTPEGEAFDKRLEEFREYMLEWVDYNLADKTKEFGSREMHGVSLVRLVQKCAELLKKCIEDPTVLDVSWASPWVEIRHSVDWDWKRNNLTGPTKEKIPDSIKKMILQEGVHFPYSQEHGYFFNQILWTIIEAHFFFELTKGAVFKTVNGQEDTIIFFNKDLRDQWSALKFGEYEDFISKLREPFKISAIGHKDRDGERNLLVFMNALDKRRGDTPLLTFEGKAGGKPYQGTLVLMVKPLEVNEDTKKAQFPILVGLAITPDEENGPSSLETYFKDKQAFTVYPGTKTPATLNPEGWTKEEKESLWETIQKTMTGEVLESLGLTGQVDRLIKEVPLETIALTFEEKLPQAGLQKKQNERAVQDVQGSRFLEYPVPRAAHKKIKAMSLRRGLGRLFKNVSKVPDLSLKGDKALQEALSLFWEHLETYLDKEAPGKWEKTLREDGSTVLSLHGLQVKEAEELWRNAVRSMAGEQKGPGLKVTEPKTETRNRFVNGEVIIQTDLHLWPKEALQKGGEPVPPVSFYQPSSPGYVALLDKQGGLPFFSEGWVCFTVGALREKYKVHYDPYFLFPDGRKKREELAQKIKTFYEEKRDELKANPSLFEEQRGKDEEELRKIDAEIRRQEQELDELSLYDTEELSLCIFEAWMEQRTHWYKGEVLLENGSIVSTYPGHYIRLDAQGLRLRLDGGKMAGDNWRKKLIGDKLKTLSRFERSAVDKRGREVDSGDRFLKHVIDGLSEIKEGDGGDHLVIHKRLQEAGGIPSQSFYVDVSLQFMTNYFYIHEPQKGVMLLNNEAAGEALSRAKDKKLPESERKKAKKEAEGHREEIRKKPYSTRTNRALTLSNLEKWSKENKAFYGVLEDEKTNKKKQKIKREGVSLVPCKGSQGRGYTVKGWVDKVAPGESRPGPRGGVASFKTLLGGLSFFMSHKVIDLQVELSLSRGKNKTAETYWNEEAFSMLKTYQAAPPKIYGFKLTPYLPEDLEERLRRRLEESNIEALDEGENVGAIMTPSTPGGLRPIDIRAARIKAGWDQKTLAEKVGVSRVMVSYWENGKKPVPLEREAALREILKDFMESKSPPPRNP